MFDRRTKNVEIFRDTYQVIKESKTLNQKVLDTRKISHTDRSERITGVLI